MAMIAAALAAPTVRVTSVAGGDAFVCVLTETGEVWCWGDNRDGELAGATDAPFSATPVRVPLEGIVQVAAARHWAAAVRSDGTVFTWGRSGWGMRTGDPAEGVVDAAPTQVAGLTGVTQVALGELHGCALRSDQRVWCWGNDQDGRLGDAARFVSAMPQPTHGPADGIGHGGSPGATPPGMHAPTRVPSDPRAEKGFAPTEVPGLKGVSSVTAFGDRTAAIIDGQVWLWGRGAARVDRESGGPGAQPASAAEVAPARVADWTGVRSVALFNHHLLAVTETGTVLGEGAVPRWSPDLPAGSPHPWPQLTQVAQLATCGVVVARLEDGQVRVIQGSAHTRGDGGKPGPPSALALNAAQIAVARDTLFVVDRDGALWGWGAGWAGALGTEAGRSIGADQYWFIEEPKRLLGP